MTHFLDVDAMTHRRELLDVVQSKDTDAHVLQVGGDGSRLIRDVTFMYVLFVKLHTAITQKEHVNGNVFSAYWNPCEKLNHVNLKLLMS